MTKAGSDREPLLRVLRDGKILFRYSCLRKQRIVNPEKGLPLPKSQRDWKSQQFCRLYWESEQKIEAFWEALMIKQDNAILASSAILAFSEEELPQEETGTTE